MADVNNSMPIRSLADGCDNRVHIKIFDGTTSPAVNAVQVDDQNTLHVKPHGLDPSGNKIALHLSEGGFNILDGIYDAVTNTIPSTVGNVLHVRNDSPDETHQTLRWTGINGATDTDVWAADVAIRDQNGDAYTTANPLPVYSVATENGVEIHDFNEAVDAAFNTPVNHDYTTAAKTLIRNLIFTSSGYAKFEVQVGDGTTFDTLTVAMTSAQNKTVEVSFGSPKEVALGEVVRIIKTNLEECNDINLYSTIVGQEIT